MNNSLKNPFFSLMCFMKVTWSMLKSQCDFFSTHSRCSSLQSLVSKTIFATVWQCIEFLSKICPVMSRQESNSSIRSSRRPRFHSCLDLWLSADIDLLRKAHQVHDRIHPARVEMLMDIISLQ
jgi:hypothetical protein